VASSAGMTARSYARILDANDRVRLEHRGCGVGGETHVHMVNLASKQTPVETVAVCDLWSLAREHRAARVKDLFNLESQRYQSSEQLLAGNDLDGVMIATADFQHAKLCTEVVRAGRIATQQCDHTRWMLGAYEEKTNRGGEVRSRDRQGGSRATGQGWLHHRAP
jgi:hypothetical protein